MTTPKNITPIFGCVIDDKNVEFEPNGPVFKIAPLSFAALKEIVSNPKAPLTLQVHNAVVTSRSDADFTPGQEHLVEFPLSSCNAVSAFCLLPGGWSILPFPSTTGILLDRNIYSDLEKANAVGAWYAVAIRNSGVRVDPVLCAVEGKNKWFPSREDFVQELQDCTATSLNILPEECVAPFDPARAEHGYSLFVEAVRPRREREIEFLLEAREILNPKPKKDLRTKSANLLFQLAERHNIKPGSFCFIATLLYLYEASASPLLIGSKLMKFAECNYDCHTAYNSLMDVSAVEAVAAVVAMESVGGYSLITADKGLAALWSASAPVACFENDVLTIYFELAHNLFFDLTEKQLMLLQQKISY